MPRKPIDYSNTHFYKLCCNDLNVTDIYVGHTTDFRKRKNQHKRNCNTEGNKHYNFPVYQFIRQHNGWSNWDMILLESYECRDALEARKIEREFIEQLNATLNKHVPSRSKKEYYPYYYENCMDKHKEHVKKYKDANRDQIRERGRLYYHANIEKHREYQQQNQEAIRQQRKQYREDHREEILQKKKQYYETKKEQLLEKMRAKVTCEICNVVYSHGDRARHCKSLTHQRAMEVQSIV